MFNKHMGNPRAREAIIAIVTICPSTTNEIAGLCLGNHGLFVDAVENELLLMQEDRTLSYVQDPIDPINQPCLWMLYAKAKSGGFVTLDFNPAAGEQVSLICRDKLDAWRDERTDQDNPSMEKHRDFLDGLDQAEQDFKIKPKKKPGSR